MKSKSVFSALFFAAFFATFFLTACTASSPENTQESCHTELVSVPLETSVVADAEVVHTGQSISGVVKDHAKKVKDYTKDMFLVDNPHIAERKPFTKLDPCDSTKVKYVSIPLHSGDTVYLRYPYQIDTIPGDGHSIVWEKGSGRLRHLIDMDDEGRFIVSEQDISCEEEVEAIQPIQTPKIDGNESSPWSNFWGWWRGFFSEIPPSWIIGLICFLILFFWIRHQGRQTRDVVRNCHVTTRGLNEAEHGTTRNLVMAEHKTTRSGLSEVVSAIKEQTTAANNQVAETKQTNDLLQKILKQGGLSGRRSSKRESSSSSSSSSKN